MLLLYVDNVFYTGNDFEQVIGIKTKLICEFKTHDTREPEKYLDLQIMRDKVENSLKTVFRNYISQS